MRYAAVVAALLLALASCQRTRVPPSVTAANATSAQPAPPSTPTTDSSDSLESAPSVVELSPPTDGTVSTSTSDQGQVSAAPIEPSDAEEAQRANGQVATADAGKTEVPGAAPADDEPTALPPDEPKERILLLSPGGPIVIDVRLNFRGENIGAALERLVDEAMKAADEDGDGKATWTDVANNPRFRSGQYGNLAADTDEERRQLIRIYDADNDGLVDREELPRFLTRNIGGGKSFSLRSSNEYRSSNRRRSATRLLLDADRDGAITAEEINAAPERLLNRDTDDDEIVLLAELKDTVEEMMPQPAMMPNRRRVTEPETAVWLTDKSLDLSKRWGMYQFQLQELYSFGGKIVASDWPMTSELFRTLDTDGDGELAKTEVSRLAEVPPHLILDVQFDGVDEKDRSPRIKLRHIASDFLALKPTVRELPSRVSIQLPNIEVEFLVNEDAALTNIVTAVKGQFMALDRDKNGYLEAGEVPDQFPGLELSFASLDVDGDGKVYESDLVAYFEQRSLVTRAQVRARAADQEDALFTALDVDGDGRLNAREMRHAPEKLRSFDRNGDGKVQSDEIPGSMIVAFVRGNPQQDNQLFSAPAAISTVGDESIPRWFRGMDANGDGEISRREFFGTPEMFPKFDLDQDGFLSLEEAKALDKP